MKRFWFLMMAALALLCGCGGDPAQTTQPPMTAQTVQGLYGLTVRVVQEPEKFGHFSAGAAGQEEAAAALELLEAALAEYPEGFLEQLGPVEILLVGPLTGVGEFAQGHYAGFTQRCEDGWRMVLDVTACTCGTIHHEFAHVIDGILTEAGTLRVEEWMAFCPSGFSYSADYGQLPEEAWALYADFFVDAYAMVSVEEDRARLFETAVLSGEGAFGDKPALWLKLDWFCRAVRAYFDTEGWPARTIWEMALE